jgi:hypothetical protein
MCLHRFSLSFAFRVLLLNRFEDIFNLRLQFLGLLLIRDLLNFAVVFVWDGRHEGRFLTWRKLLEDLDVPKDSV